MRTTLIILVVLAVLFIAASLWVRLAPLDPARLTARPGPDTPGQHELVGGLKVVIAMSELPADAVGRLTALVLATPATRQLGDGAFVTRSRFWGFPDITRIWVADGHLHIHGALVYGRSDLGVNSARIRGWLDALRQG